VFECAYYVVLCFLLLQKFFHCVKNFLTQDSSARIYYAVTLNITV